MGDVSAGINWVDISATLGLCAMVWLTLNLLLGMLISSGYKRSVVWKRLPIRIKNLNLVEIHNWTGYTALLLVISHPSLLLLDKTTKFHAADILFPALGPHQPFWATWGALAFYALILVVVTSYKPIKKRMNFRVWKNIHLISYGTAFVFLLHGLMMDPELKNRPVDWLDGEKVLCEICALILLSASIFRLNLFLKSRKLNNN